MQVWPTLPVDARAGERSATDGGFAGPGRRQAVAWPSRSAAALRSQPKDLARVQDVLRIERPFERAHHLDAVLARLLDQEALLVQAHPVFAGARAFQPQCALDQLQVQPLGGVPLRRVLRVDEAGENSVEMMRTLKRALDPKNILNPGKIFRL